MKIVKDERVDCTASALAYELSCDLIRNHRGKHWDDEYGLPFDSTTPGYDSGNYAPDANA